MIIFGASGDLTKRKLMPALYSLYREKRLTGEFSILGIGRTVYSDDNYRSNYNSLSSLKNRTQLLWLHLSPISTIYRWTRQKKKVTRNSANVWLN